MTDTTTQQAQASVNGQHSGPVPDAPCEDCATNGEKVLAVVAALIGLLVIVVAADMFTGGKISDMIPQRGETGAAG